MLKLFRILFLFLMTCGLSHAGIYTTHPDRPVGNIKSTLKNPDTPKSAPKDIRTTRVDRTLKIENDTIIITPELCRSLTITYQTPQDILYTPNDPSYKGVRVDTNPHTIKVPESIRIPIRYSRLSRQESTNATSPANSAFKSDFIDEIPLGFIDFQLKSGDIKFNGKSLTEDYKNNLLQLCRDLLEASS